MKTKKITPLNVAPVKRENAATVSRDGNVIAPQQYLDAKKMGSEELEYWARGGSGIPFAGDDAD